MDVIASTLEVTGVVDVVTFRNDETGYAIMKLKPDRQYRDHPVVDRKGRITLLGTLAQINLGDRVKVMGDLKSHSKFGPQINVTNFQLMQPQNLHELERYLAKNISSIGEEYAHRIVSRFGMETIDVIDKNPEQLCDIDGIGTKRLAQIKKHWIEHTDRRSLIVFFTRVGLSTTFIDKVQRKYGATSVERIKNDPYTLARDIEGIGFVTADGVAKQVGVHEVSNVRVRALAEHILNENAEQHGDCFMYSTDLLNAIMEFLEKNNTRIDVQRVTEWLDEAIELHILEREENRIYVSSMFHLENSVADYLVNLLCKRSPLPEDLNKILETAIEAAGVTLHAKQLEAITKSMRAKVSVITGGPGTGKTTIIRCLLAGFLAAGLPVHLMAPTGRAAKRMREVMQYDAATIHRVLYPLGKAVSEGSSAESVQIHGVVIVDEISMVDLKTFNWLLRFLADDVILVLVGDKDQLPSVGAGAVLRDLMNSHVIPVTELTEIFRQARGSDICEVAQTINRGEMPEMYARAFGRNIGVPANTNFYTTMIPDASEQAKAAVWCATTFAERCGFNPLTDCQVLAPMYKGDAGVNNLNLLLQQALNPNPSTWVDRGMGVRWGIGDKLMQIKNNYPKEVFNGDIGVITEILKQPDGALEKLVMNFDGQMVEFNRKPASTKGHEASSGPEWSNLVLAYATTVHKVQGSEYPMVVMLLHPNHYTMLMRNLLYTGITRSRQRVVLIWHPQALEQAIRNNRVSRRNSFLAQKVQKNIEIVLDAAQKAT